MNPQKYITCTIAALALASTVGPVHAGQYTQTEWSEGISPPEMSFSQLKPYPSILVKAGDNGYIGLDKAKTVGFWLGGDVSVTCGGGRVIEQVNIALKRNVVLHKTGVNADTILVAKASAKGSTSFHGKLYAGGNTPPQFLVDEAVQACNAELAERAQQSGKTKSEILAQGFTLPYTERSTPPDALFASLGHCRKALATPRRMLMQPPKVTFECGSNVASAPEPTPNTQPKPQKVTALHLNRTGNMSVKGSCPFTMKFKSTINVSKSDIPVKFQYKTHDGIESEVFTKTSTNGGVQHVTQIVVGEKNKGSNLGNPKGKVYQGELRLLTKAPSIDFTKKEWSFECLPEGQDIGMQQPDPNPQPQPQDPKPQPKQVVFSLPDLVKATKIMIGGKAVNQNGVVELTKADSLGMDKGKCAFVANWVTANSGAANAGKFQTLITSKGSTLATKGHSALKAGASVAGSSRLYLANGLHILNFETDKANQVMEENEKNNTQGVRLTVSGCNP